MEKLFNETARIEEVIYLAGAISQVDCFPDRLRRFLEGEFEAIDEALGEMPEYCDLEADRNLMCEMFFDWMRDTNRFGYLVQFATPVMRPTGKNSAMFSWGHYTTTWVYGDTIAEAVRKGMKWVKAQRKLEATK
jgi:hypothetical protein